MRVTQCLHVVARPLNNFDYPDKMHRRIIVAYVIRSHLCDKNEYKTICKRSQERYMMHLHAPHFIHIAIILFRLDRHQLKRDTKVKRVRIPPFLFHHTAHDDTLT